jgi:hypothetical protein
MDPRHPQFKPVLRIEDMSFGAGPATVRQTVAPSQPGPDGVPAPPARDGAEKSRHRSRLAWRS